MLPLLIVILLVGAVQVGAAQFDPTTSEAPADATSLLSPQGVAVGSDNSIYVADTFNHVIRKITPTGIVSTLAGMAGNVGSNDGTSTGARFNHPYGIAVDNTGNVYVADVKNSTIRKVTPEGVVSTLAGLAGSFESNDGVGSAARFNSPTGVAVDALGNVYVADTSNHAIRKISPAGEVTTYAGLLGSLGNADGSGGAARFHFPYGVTVDNAGTIYVADTENHTIRKIGPDGIVSTVAGRAGTDGSDDGMGGAARFRKPCGLSVDGAGNVYVADYANRTVRKVTPGGMVTTLAGLAGGFGSTDGIGSDARFGSEIAGGPSYVAVNSAGTVYVSDSANNTIRKITSEGVVSTLAGRAGSSAVVENHIIRLGAVTRTQLALNPNSLVRLPNGRFSFEVTTSANQIVFIQATSDLAAENWTTLASISIENGRLTFTDPSASNFPHRFYRAVSP